MKVPALGLAALLLASACGGSTSVDTADTVAPEVTEASEAADAPTSNAANEAIGESRTDIERYCELNIEADEKSDAFNADLPNQPPAEVAAYLTVQKRLIEEAIQVADPVIRPQLILVQERILDMDRVLSGHGYKFEDAADDLVPVLTNNISVEDRALLTDYNFINCGIVADGSGSEASTVTTLVVDSDDPLTPSAEQVAVAAEVLTQLQNEAERGILVDAFMSQLPNMSVEKFECFIENLTPEGLASWTKLSELSPDDFELGASASSSMTYAMDTCQVTFAELR